MRIPQLLTACLLLAACGEPEVRSQPPPEPAAPAIDDLPVRPEDEEEALSDDPAERTTYWIELMCQGHPYEQKRAYQELGRIGKPAVPQLISLLGVKRASEWACEALAEIGPDAVEAAPRLVEKLEDPRVRTVARFALLQIGDGARDALDGAREHEDEGVRTDAEWVLERLDAEDAK